VSTPSIYDYLDHRRFLAEWFRAKKRENPRYSYRLFARKAGQRSPSLLHHIIEGERNLTSATTESFIEAIGLTGPDAQFFRLLVDLDQAKTSEERNLVWEKIASTRRFREARRIEGASFEYLSNWYVPAIRELAQRPDFVADADWIAQTLRPKIPAKKAKAALDLLKTLGMLIEDADGLLIPAEASVVTPPEVVHLAVENYHRGMLERAADSINGFPAAERHLIAITVAAPEALVPRMKEEANAFLERMMNLCDDSSADADRVYQLNLQLFPLSSSREDDS
jgi:uncharacterized protein (TIGR02147 family)